MGCFFWIVSPPPPGEDVPFEPIQKKHPILRKKIRAAGPGASGLTSDPITAPPPVCIPDVIGALSVRKTKQKILITVHQATADLVSNLPNPAIHLFRVYKRHVR